MLFTAPSALWCVPTILLLTTPRPLTPLQKEVKEGKRDAA